MRHTRPYSTKQRFVFLRCPSRCVRSLNKRQSNTMPTRTIRCFNEQRPFSLLIVSNGTRVIMRRLLFKQCLFRVIIIFHRGPFIQLIRPVTFTIIRFIRNLNVGLIMICQTINICYFHRFCTSRPTATTKINRRILLITNNSRQNVSTRLRRNVNM